MKTILTAVPDMMFETRIADVARARGFRVDTFSAQSEHGADLIIVGLENNREWPSVVQAARTRNLPVLAFGRHTSVDLLRQARQAGCTRVVVNSDIAQKLPDLLDELLNIPTSNSNPQTPMPDCIEDNFDKGISPYWVRFAVGHANIEVEKGIARFVVAGAEAGKLSDAEIDDHRALPRHRLSWTPPLRLSVRARMSHRSGEMLGTAGFGFWNDPFDWTGNVQVPPNALWFFYASPHSDMAFAPNVRGHGWKAALLNAGRADPLTMAIGNFVFRLPGMSRIVFAAAQARTNAHEKTLDEFALADWHDYRIDWLAQEARFLVDGKEVFIAPNPPRVPLGFVAWVDNNFAVMGPGREFAFGRMAIAHRQWMELAQVRIERML